MRTGSRLAVGATVVIVVTAYMAFVGGSSSWQYYVTVDECLTNSPELLNNRLRVSGKIVQNSLFVNRDRGEATFLLEGTGGNLSVKYQGLLPDNLAEQREVVVEGQLEDKTTLRGDKVLTRCASKYSSQTSKAVQEHSPPN
jgi:cytochrome c-type biogenesis protein CcmE